MVLFIRRPTWQSLDLQIGTDGVKVVTKDRRIIELSFQVINIVTNHRGFVYSQADLAVIRPTDRHRWCESSD